MTSPSIQTFLFTVESWSGILGISDDDPMRDPAGSPPDPTKSSGEKRNIEHAPFNSCRLGRGNLNNQSRLTSTKDPNDPDRSWSSSKSVAEHPEESRGRRRARRVFPNNTNAGKHPRILEDRRGSLKILKEPKHSCTGNCIDQLEHIQEGDIRHGDAEEWSMQITLKNPQKSLMSPPDVTRILQTVPEIRRNKEKYKYRKATRNSIGKHQSKSERILNGTQGTLSGSPAMKGKEKASQRIISRSWSVDRSWWLHLEIYHHSFNSH